MKSKSTSLVLIAIHCKGRCYSGHVAAIEGSTQVCLSMFSPLVTLSSINVPQNKTAEGNSEIRDNFAIVTFLKCGQFYPSHLGHSLKLVLKNDGKYTF